MSIATEITRLQTAKADLKTAIEGKGVTVPSATKIDGYADLVDAIQTGGGDDMLAALCNGTLTDFDNDNITALASPQILRANTTVTRVFLKNCKSMSAQYTLAGKAVVTIVLPSLETITNQSGYGFSDTNALKKIDLGESFLKSGNIVSGFFSGTKATVIVLRNKNGVVPLANTNNFNNTPFASGGTGGTLYVPSALISSYQSATNWSTILGYANNSIEAIEGSQYENYYADGTPISA